MGFLRRLLGKKQLSVQNELEKLIRDVADDNTDFDARSAAALALIRLGKPAYRSFSDILASHDLNTRSNANEAIEWAVSDYGLKGNIHAINIVRAALKKNQGSMYFMSNLLLLSQLDDRLAVDIAEAMRSDQEVRFQRLLNTIKLP